MSFKGERVVLVTGASGGIGGAICRRIAGPGTAIVMHGRGGDQGGNLSGLDAVAKDAGKAGAQVKTVTCDLAREGAGEMLVERTISYFGRLDQIVSNAGYADSRLFGQANTEDLDSAYRVIAVAFFDIVTAAMTQLRRSERGRVVAVSSFAAHHFRVGGLYPATAAAKSAMEVLARSLAAQLAPDQVTVNNVAPGYTRKSHLGNPGVWERAAEITPMGRIAEPDDVAALVEFLLSDGARHITGQTIGVDGGLGLG